nr:MAG TPA: hypothetical protein [Crassvirales sp.]DAG91026.1 MAG TPA: hypothetical protein [Crassvirales sp.]
MKILQAIINTLRSSILRILLFFCLNLFVAIKENCYFCIINISITTKINSQ